MEDLLFLSHRIPYPPNKGDKIRSFNLLKHLAGDYRIHLGTFVDDPEDRRYRDAVAEYCADMYVADLDPRWGKAKSLVGLLTGEPLTLPYFRHRGLQSWVNDVIGRRGIRRAFVFSSAMTQYVDHHRQVSRVADFVDVDSDKWAQYATTKSWPMDWVYRRESRRLLAFERKVAGEFDATTFVSDEEAALFSRLAPEAANRVSAVRNGVDTDYFAPDGVYENPYDAGGPVCVFTGAMDYWANVEAVVWFAEDVLPTLRRRVPGTRFYIVGARPTGQVQALSRHPGVVVTGAVHDIRPYLAHGDVAVAPLRIARGVQNKVLEAMAMGCMVVATSAAAEGLHAEAGRELMVADGALYGEAVAEALAARNAAMGQAARQRVLREYNWESSLSRLERLMEDAVGRGTAVMGQTASVST